MEQPIVILDGVTKRFGSVVAVAGFCFEIKEGEFITLLGPSGCGKTTTLRILGGLEKPTEGKVYIDGKDMTNVPAHKRPVNLVFQSYALFPHMTVYENIAFGPSLRKVPEDEIRQDVERLLALVQLEGFGERRVTQMSGGQMQRVALARALINRPRVLLLDEPLGSLDLKLRKEMQLELKAIHRQLKTTFVYVTHDQEEALVMSDRIVVMNEGRIVQVGTGREVYEQPNSTFVSAFIGETNLFGGEVAEVYEDRALIDINGLEVVVPLVDGLRGGQDISISVRPEAIRMAHEVPPEGSDNVFSAEVTSVIFLGPMIKYQIRLPNGQLINVWTMVIDAKRTHKLGDKVKVYLPLDSIIVMVT